MFGLGADVRVRGGGFLCQSLPFKRGNGAFFKYRYINGVGAKKTPFRWLTNFAAPRDEVPINSYDLANMNQNVSYIV